MMTPPLRLTRHALEKFEVLRRHGFEVTPAQVEATVSDPESVVRDTGDRFIAQRALSDSHLLRVVFRNEGTVRVVITFYPGRRERYEGQLRPQ